jgi:hypothetical protein
MVREGESGVGVRWAVRRGVCVWSSIDTHTHTHTHTNTHTYICTFTYIHTYIHAYIHP